MALSKLREAWIYAQRIGGIFAEEIKPRGGIHSLRQEENRLVVGVIQHDGFLLRNVDMRLVISAPDMPSQANDSFAETGRRWVWVG